VSYEQRSELVTLHITPSLISAICFAVLVELGWERGSGYNDDNQLLLETLAMILNTRGLRVECLMGVERET
jgi:hypothetical protein